MVTPEYNQCVPGSFKNAIDRLYTEWNNKAVGFVSYGAAGGVRAVEQLRLICGALQMADVTAQVTLSLLTEFENYTTFKPGDYHGAALDALLDQVVAWVRGTLCFRKTDGRWLIAHDHVSVPLEMPSGEAAADLEP